MVKEYSLINIRFWKVNKNMYCWNRTRPDFQRPLPTKQRAFFIAV